MRKVVVRIKEKPAPQPEAVMPEEPVFTYGASKEAVETALRLYRNRRHQSRQSQSLAQEEMTAAGHDKPK